MAFTIDEAFLPATLTAPPMTDEQFAEFCAEHPDLSFEVTAEGVMIGSPPKFSLTGTRNSKITKQLETWAEADARGVTSDSSTGCVLPSGARRSPDAAWTSNSKLVLLSPESLESYWHLCPDFVIELKSKTDRIPTLREKMQEWIDNGARLAWLIDPDTESVEVYRPNQEPQVLLNIDAVLGEGPVDGFTLHLKPVWHPLAR